MLGRRFKIRLLSYFASYGGASYLGSCSSTCNAGATIVVLKENFLEKTFPATSNTNFQAKICDRLMLKVVKSGCKNDILTGVNFSPAL